MKCSILIINENLTACKQIKYNIQNQLTEVYYALDVEEALHFLAKHRFTLVVLSLTLSETAGPVLTEAMSRQVPAPMLILTSEVYVPKHYEDISMDFSHALGTPYSMELARQKAEDILRAQAPDPERRTRSYLFACGSNLVIDLDNRSVELDGTPLTLTRKNYELLLCLARNAGVVTTKEALFEEIWKANYDINADDAIKFQIKNLRREFDKLGHYKIIETIWGVGYKLHAEKNLLP